MMSTAEHSNGDTTSSTRYAMVALSSLFFIWGFITALNDVLIPYLKGLFDLTYLQAMAVNLCFFGAYALVSYPAGHLIEKIGYRKGIVTGLLIAAFGCLLFYPASILQMYSVFLAGLFILASGITILQVSANPFVTCIGPAETASSRLNLTQAFNSLGTTIAPIFGSILILALIVDPTALQSLTGEALTQAKVEQSEAVQLPYLLLTIALMTLAFTFHKFIKLPDIEVEQSQNDSDNSAWQHKHLILGAVAIFVYVGAEVSIGSFLVNFLGEDNIAGLPEHTAAKYVSIYWGGAMVGRFVGAWLMLRVKANLLLAFNSLMVVAFLAVVVSTEGQIAMWAILAIGLFNSIMFPTIFSLAVKGLGKATSQGSGILCVAIVGGALIPLVQGALADRIGIQLAFVAPIFCYLYITFYGLAGFKVKSVQQ